MENARNPVEEDSPDNADHKIVLTTDRNDGNLNISFSQGDLEARSDFLPPIGSGRPLSLENVTAFLNRINIVYGVRREDIQKAVLDCNMHRRQINDLLIAKGDSPVSEVAEYFEIDPKLTESGQRTDDTGQVDHRSFSPFIIVKKDQILAKLKAKKPGKTGKNIHGDEIPFPVIRPEGVSAGENTRITEGVLLSNIDGQLIQKNNILSVQDSLVIKGSVGYATGNIIFPGDVLIEGEVAQGFKIHAGGNLVIKQTLDATDVITKGDLVVSGGMIGRGPALVKSNGGIKTKFIENCRVAARKTISVESDIINSSVFTLESIEMGEKGVIIGGDIYAVRGIRAAGIGKESGKATTLHCGIDFTAQQEKEKINNQLHILSAKLAKVRSFLNDPGAAPEKCANFEELLARLEKEQAEASAKVSELLGKINADENAAVEVKGEITIGTLIEICQITLLVTEPLRNVRIKLDRAAGRLLPTAL